jgi:hypothetical protein
MIKHPRGLMIFRTVTWYSSLCHCLLATKRRQNKVLCLPPNADLNSTVNMWYFWDIYLLHTFIVNEWSLTSTRLYVSMAWSLGQIWYLFCIKQIFLKIRAFWDIQPCSLLGVDRRFRGVYCLHHQSDEILLVRTFETSVYFNETTRCYIPKSSNLHTRSRENLKSHTISFARI